MFELPVVPLFGDAVFFFEATNLPVEASRFTAHAPVTLRTRRSSSGGFGNRSSPFLDFAMNSSLAARVRGSYSLVREEVGCRHIYPEGFVLRPLKIAPGEDDDPPLILLNERFDWTFPEWGP